MVNLKVFFMIRDGYPKEEIMRTCNITADVLYRAKRKYEKEMGVTVNWKRSRAGRKSEVEKLVGPV